MLAAIKNRVAKRCVAASSAIPYDVRPMAKPRRSSVRKYHDRVAPRYDHSYGDTFWQWHDALTWDYLKPFLPRDANAEVVDLGCGTGTWAARLLKSGYAVTCVDISRRMLDQADAKIAEQALRTPATFVQADLVDLASLGEHRYALAIALGDPIGCTDSPPKALKEIRRILTPGGVLVATFDNRLAAIDYYLQGKDPRVLSRFLRDGRTHWLTRDKDEQFPIVTYTPRGVTDLVKAAGFEVIDLVGKTVLPMRHHRELLETSQSRRTWARIEKTLCRNPDALSLASHLQITCRTQKR